MACGKRIPRWEKGRETRRMFCNSGCSSHYQRTRQIARKHHSSPRVEIASEVPAAQRFVSQPAPTERPPEHAPCEACGRMTRFVAGEPVFCNQRCRDYRPLPPRKAGGAWYFVAGPVPHCADCGLVIMPRADGILLPRRGIDGKVRCEECAPVKHTRFAGKVAA
jgi:hypothetical protein